MVKEMLCPGLQVLSPEPPTGLGWSQRTFPLTQPLFLIPWALSVLRRFLLEVPHAVFQYKRKLFFFYEEAVRVSVMLCCEGRWTKKLCLFPRKPHMYVAQFYYYFVRLGKLSCLWTGHGFVALLMLLGCFSCCYSFRQVLFGDNPKKPQSLSDTDLSKLYTATSLMQIDDNVMRYEGWLSDPI